MLKNIRTRLTIWYVLAFGILLLTFSAFLYFSIAKGLYRRLDDAVSDEAGQVASLYVNEVSENAGDLAAGARETMDEFRAPNVYVAIILNGQVLAGNFPERMNSIPDQLDFGRENRLPIGTMIVPPDMKARFAYLVVDVQGTRCHVLAARPIKEVAAQLNSIRQMFYLGLPAALLISGFGGWLLAGKSLAPVLEMSDQAELITARSLDQRLKVKNREDELGRLASVFNELLSRLNRSFESMREFMADASHELRTPVAIIRGEADVALSQDRSTADYKEALRVIQDESRHLSRIIDDLLELARAEAGQRPLEHEDFYLNDLVEDCCRSAQVLANSSGVSLSMQPSPDVPFRGDKSMLTRMLLNLVHNAIKFTPPPGSVLVSLRVTGDCVEIAVADTGVGIEADLAGRVFSRFYKNDRGRKSAIAGAGLGLSIAKWVAEAHGGSISLESSPGRGSTFTISLPYQYPE